ncbi:MAG: ATP-dependent Clp protease ATP-binding subunit [Clostridia bacterium]|nr:ATP-dependent Clp protease ATP-binding subunit [Clostridia bacterium]
MLCIKCKERPAVLFVNKTDTATNQQSTEGYCLKCAQELNIGPVDNILKQMGLTPDQLDEINEGMSDFVNSLGGYDPESDEEFDPENSPLAMMNGFSNMFGGNQNDELSGGGVKTAKRQKKAEKRILDSFGTNLTAKAQDKLIDRIVGRDAEISRVIQILNRRSKNNPVLLGEPGVGKTAIAEGLAVRIAEKKVPAKLFDKEVYLLDFTAVVAGTQFRGQFEARLKKILEEAKKLGNIILVIDEIHNIVGAGDAEGAMSAANILKPALARGDIQVLGATTLDEYRKHIEKDSALERRFQPVIVDEPTMEDTVEILKGIKDYYENYHRVKISDDVIEQSVYLAERYITDRFLPDKAIDVIDEAGSKANLQNKKLIELKKLNDRLKAVQAEKENAVSSDSTEDYQKAAELKAKECALVEKINKLNESGIDTTLTLENIAEVIEDWTKIPVKSLTETESEKLLNLESRIKEYVLGQDHAVTVVAEAIRRNRARLTRARRPVSFIFAGPTGVGKTELAKTLARVMFDSEDAMIRIDMSEYMEKHTVSKLIGAPPGYVGYDDAGQLTEKVRRKPYSIILLDEIEKAHADVFNILLQILDDGRVADSHGRIVNFENTVIIMTSNAGSQVRSASLGFNKTEDDSAQARTDMALKEIFRPEFLNRVDDIITFKSLSRENLVGIVDLMIKELATELFRKEIILVVDDSAKELILEKGYDTKFGARPLRRAIEKNIQNEIASLVIRGEAKQHCKIKVSAQDGEFKVEVENI